jgi:seryl-tRNA synthetase
VCVTDGSEEVSEKELQYVLDIQKMILKKLGLHCRVLELPTEDMGGDDKCGGRKWNTLFSVLFLTVFHFSFDVTLTRHPAPAYHKYDIEAWMPSFGKYGEVTSASNCLDYQRYSLSSLSQLYLISMTKFSLLSRRLNIRSTKAERETVEREKKGDGDKRKYPFVHTINGTALAVPRIIIAILEQHQVWRGRGR